MFCWRSEHEKQSIPNSKSKKKILFCPFIYQSVEVTQLWFMLWWYRWIRDGTEVQNSWLALQQIVNLSTRNDDVVLLLGCYGPICYRSKFRTIIIVWAGPLSVFSQNSYWNRTKSTVVLCSSSFSPKCQGVIILCFII